LGLVSPCPLNGATKKISLRYMICWPFFLRQLGCIFFSAGFPPAAFYSAAKPHFIFRRRPAANSAAEGSTQWSPLWLIGSRWNYYATQGVCTLITKAAWHAYKAWDLRYCTPASSGPRLYIDWLIDWLTTLRHISTERLLVSRNVAK